MQNLKNLITKSAIAAPLKTLNVVPKAFYNFPESQFGGVQSNVNPSTTYLHFLSLSLWQNEIRFHIHSHLSICAGIFGKHT